MTRERDSGVFSYVYTGIHMSAKRLQDTHALALELTLTLTVAFALVNPLYTYTHSHSYSYSHLHPLTFTHTHSLSFLDTRTHTYTLIHSLIHFMLSLSLSLSSHSLTRTESGPTTASKHVVRTEKEREKIRFTKKEKSLPKCLAQASMYFRFT